MATVGVKALTGNTRIDKHNIVYCQAYIAEMTFKGHSSHW